MYSQSRKIKNLKNQVELVDTNFLSLTEIEVGSGKRITIKSILSGC